VVTDSGLGVRGMRRALRGSHPDHVIGIQAGLALARTLRLPGQRISARALAGLADSASAGPMPGVPDREAEAVVAFTSGATGPAKGVIYRQWQVERTRDALAEHYGIADSDSLVAAFAPWSILGPTLGIPSVIPAMDVTKPRTLTAIALADAARAVAGSLLWSSPAALANVIRTAERLTERQRAALAGVRIAMFAGAPVPIASLVRARELFSNAVIRTPYGMTEALPVADVTLDEVVDAGPRDGVLVGRPIPGVELAVCPLDQHGSPCGTRTTRSDVTGEILVRGDHIRDGYDGLWATDHRAWDDGWHRTGDVGHLDAAGRLWIEGRLAHVISTADGPVTPVGIEQRVQELDFVDLAAAVGIGPAGCQQLVVVVTGAPGREVLLDTDRTGQVREHLVGRLGVRAPVAAVLRRGRMPVDIRHNSKIDRGSVAEWAAGVLSGAAR
jgi:long-subunit acyl-CoA synthetase (AMP-forming)